jgi:hypothetical protein
VDAIHYAHMIENKVWNLFSLASISKRYDLPPNLGTDIMMIDT